MNRIMLNSHSRCFDGNSNQHVEFTKKFFEDEINPNSSSGKFDNNDNDKFILKNMNFGSGS